MTDVDWDQWESPNHCAASWRGTTKGRGWAPKSMKTTLCWKQQLCCHRDEGHLKKRGKKQKKTKKKLFQKHWIAIEHHMTMFHRSASKLAPLPFPPVVFFKNLFKHDDVIIARDDGGTRLISGERAQQRSCAVLNVTAHILRHYKQWWDVEKKGKKNFTLGLQFPRNPLWRSPHPPPRPQSCASSAW